MSQVFLPAAPTIRRLAARVEEERRHALALEPEGEPLARLTGEPCRVIDARVNRATGAASVTAASVGQLQQGSALLEREAARRR